MILLDNPRNVEYESNREIFCESMTQIFVSFYTLHYDIIISCDDVRTINNFNIIITDPAEMRALYGMSYEIYAIAYVHGRHYVFETILLISVWITISLLLQKYKQNGWYEDKNDCTRSRGVRDKDERLKKIK